MKFYVLFDPIANLYFQYKTSGYTTKWTTDLERAKKWSYKSSAATCKSQSYNKEINQCEVLTINYKII